VDPNITNEPRPNPPRAEPPGPATPEEQHPAADQPPSFSDEPPPLGSLAQVARLKLLRRAQGFMLVAGLFVIFVQGSLFFNVEDEIEIKLLQDGRMNRAMVGPVQLAELRRLCYLVYGIGIGMGLFFLLMIPIIRVAPVPATVLALVVYIGGVVAFIALTPATLPDFHYFVGGISDVHGFFWKILIFLQLMGSIGVAVAYEREKRESLEPLPAQ
jgi:hypothetical protein